MLYFIPDLQPGTTYELSVQLVDVFNFTQDPFFSPDFNFTTFRSKGRKYLNIVNYLADFLLTAIASQLVEF